MEIDNKTLKRFIVIGVLLVLFTIVGISYALWTSLNTQNEKNIVHTDCFKLKFNESNDINLTNTYPIIESDALLLTPYTFTIKNECSLSMAYQINLETLDTTTFDPSHLRYKLDNQTSKLLSAAPINSSGTVRTDAINSRKLEKGILIGGQEKTYDFRIWIDEDATIESANKYFEGKIVVISTLSETNHEITLNTNGGQVGSTTIEVIIGKEIGILPTPTKEGFEFVGWYLDENFNNQVIDTTIVTKDMINLYAKYEEE